MSFLKLKDKTFFITGVANKKSIAYHVAKTLESEGARLLLSVQNEDILSKVEKLFPEQDYFLLDVTNKEHLTQLTHHLEKNQISLDGFLHSIAFAPYSEKTPSFEETPWEDFALASQISLHSLMSLSSAIKHSLKEEASIVAMSISNTRVASYGYMGPIKAALDSSVSYLAKSLSQKRVRVNAVCAGPLKTSASAGIPGYINNYLYAEQLTLRKEALKTAEVANSAVFLLSQASSGVNASHLYVDAGMSSNYFDQDIVNKVTD